MKNQTSRPRLLIALVAAALSCQVPLARAELVGTDQLTGQHQAENDRAKVRNFLERANVKERLQALGVNGIAAEDRVAALSEEEVHALAQRIDSMPAGAALSNTDLILILLAIILVAIII